MQDGYDKEKLWLDWLSFLLSLYVFLCLYHVSLACQK